MKLTGYLVACGLLAVTLGCATHPPTFAEQHKHLAGSRRVGDQTRNVKWQPLRSFHFTQDSLDDVQVLSGEWVVADGELQAIAGRHNRTVLLQPGAPGPIRVTMELTNYANADGSIGDITVLLNAENGKGFFNSGYALTTGSYFNSCSTFYRLGKAIAKTEYSPLQSGRPYKVVVEVVDGHIRYWLDDEIVLEAWDSTPLTLAEDLWIGVRTWNTRMAIRQVTIEQGER